MQQRQTAYKLWVSSVHSSNFVKTTEEFSPNYIELDNKKISRVNLVATVVNKYENLNYISLVIDDSSSQISIKTWDKDTSLLKNINVSDIVLIIGKLKQSNLTSSIYILPEIVKKTTLNYELLRKLELLKEYGKPSLIEKKQDVEENITEEIKVLPNSLRQQVLNTIEKLDNNDGVSVKDISTALNESEDMINEILEDLIKEGDIFQMKNKFKII